MGASAKVGKMIRFAEKLIVLSTKPSWMSGSQNGLTKGKSGIW